MQPRQPKTYKWKDDQMALFGSDLEWSATLKRQAVKSEPAWNGAGQKVGTQIWRIDKSKVTNWPKVEHGTFFSHDTYIILNTQKKHGHHVSVCIHVKPTRRWSKCCHFFMTCNCLQCKNKLFTWVLSTHVCMCMERIFVCHFTAHIGL